MKKIIKAAALFLCAALLVLPLFSCAQSVDDGKPSIVCTAFAPYDFAREIAGESANITLLTTPGSDTHSYDPTPRDIVKINKCDIFIYVGGESDAWVEKILASVDNKDMRIVKLVECVGTLYEEEHKEGMSETGDHHGHEEESYDEHVWTDPKNAVLICERITEALASVDEANAEDYSAAFEAYKAELAALDADFRAVVENGVRKEIIFGDRFPLLYFIKAYNLDYYAAFPGCAAESEPSGATVAFLINKVKENSIPVVFHLELSEGRIADTICEATGAKKLRFNACHNISKAEFDAGVSYLSLMRDNVEALREALG